MKYKIAFVCVHNSCRSQMAEGWTKHLGADIFEVYSAGTESYPEIKPLAKKVMEKAGVSLAGQKPKLLSEIPEDLDILITMGCGVVCPFVPSRHNEDWGLDDPSGGTEEDFENTRDLIYEKVMDLIRQTKEGELFL